MNLKMSEEVKETGFIEITVLDRDVIGPYSGILYGREGEEVTIRKLEEFNNMAIVVGRMAMPVEKAWLVKKRIEVVKEEPKEETLQEPSPSVPEPEKPVTIKASSRRSNTKKNKPSVPQGPTLF